MVNEIRNCAAGFGLAMGLLVSASSVSAVDLQYDLALDGGPYTQEQAIKDVQKVVSRFTITEFCGRDSWSVRKGYEISRRRFLESEIVTKKEFRGMRLRAIKTAESYLDEAGPAAFNSWCDEKAEEATQFFLGLMSGDLRYFETTMK